MSIQSMQDEKEWIYGKVSSPNGRQTTGGFSSSPSDPTAMKVRRVEKLDNMIREKQELQLRCEQYVDDLPDGKLKLALRYRYILGWTWESTAQRINGSTSYQSLIKMVNGHFDAQSPKVPSYKRTQFDTL